MEDQPELLNDAMAKLKPLPPLSKEVIIRIVELSKDQPKPIFLSATPISNSQDEINELISLFKQ